MEQLLHSLLHSVKTRHLFSKWWRLHGIVKILSTMILALNLHGSSFPCTVVTKKGHYLVFVHAQRQVVYGHFFR